MASLLIQMTSDEVQAKIPYSLVCMTRYGAQWNTMRRKRRWQEEFSEHERDSASRLFSQSHNWMLGHGVPATVRMTMETFDLWQKLGAFCASI